MLLFMHPTCVQCNIYCLGDSKHYCRYFVGIQTFLSNILCIIIGEMLMCLAFCCLQLFSHFLFLYSSVISVVYQQVSDALLMLGLPFLFLLSMQSPTILPPRTLQTCGKEKNESCTIFYYYKATDKYINVLKKIRTLPLLKKSFKVIQKF